jgi:hypothetical protein
MGQSTSQSKVPGYLDSAVRLSSTEILYNARHILSSDHRNSGAATYETEQRVEHGWQQTHLR